jgi:glycosyltransferase involved in cell wall biosynthesis
VGGAQIHPAALRRFEQELARADEIVVNSHVAARTFREAGHIGTPIHVLYPVVDTDRFRPVEAERAGPFTVLYVGMITPRKGVHYLLEALGRLAPADFRLVLVGGAGTRGMRRRLATAAASIPVEQVSRDFSRDDPSEVFGRADVLVLPSVEDGFGVVALEAMASGVPVITTAPCGAADVVVEGGNGFVVPSRDAIALADRIAWMASHPEAHRTMRVAARETALHFTQAHYTERMAPLVEAAVTLGAPSA